MNQCACIPLSVCLFVCSSHSAIQTDAQISTRFVGEVGHVPKEKCLTSYLWLLDLH